MTHSIKTSISRSIWTTFAVNALALASAFADVSVFEHERDGSPVIPLIQSATRTLDIEIYDMQNAALHTAILQAVRNGVKVRILAEPTPVGSSCKLFAEVPPPPGPGPSPIPTPVPQPTPPAPTEESSTWPSLRRRPHVEFTAEMLLGDSCAATKAFKAELERLGGEMRPFSKTLCGAGSGGTAPTAGTASCVQHGKTVMADGATSIISTGNFNSSNLCDTSQNPRACNREYTLKVNTPNVISTLHTVFELDWIGAPYNLPKSLPSRALTELTVSPFARTPLTDFINSARTSVEISTQYLNDNDLNQAIIATATRGVSVKLLVASYCSFGTPSPSDVKKVTRNATAFENAGAKLMTFPSAIQVGGRPGYLHSKAIIVDGNRAWVGSVNGSTQSMDRNREFGLFFDDAVAVGKVRSSILSDFGNVNAETWQDSLNCLKDLTAPAPAPTTPTTSPAQP